MNIRNPFRRDLKPDSVIDVFRNDPTPPSAWSRLEKLGYTYHEAPPHKGKRRAWIEDKSGKSVSFLGTPETFEQRYALREQFARQALKVLAE